MKDPNVVIEVGGQDLVPEYVKVVSFKTQKDQNKTKQKRNVESIYKIHKQKCKISCKIINITLS